jgi:hypothetical protein
MTSAYNIVPAITSWCQTRGIRTPQVRKGWGYRGQTFVEWLGPPAQCQLELLPSSNDFASCNVTAHVLVCDPLCSNGECVYRVKAIPDVGTHMTELFATLDMFFPRAKDSFGFCKFMATVIDYDCSNEGVAKRARHVEYNLAQSVYREQFDKDLVNALNGEGFTEATFSQQGRLRISWEKPASPQEQKLFDMFES